MQDRTPMEALQYKYNTLKILFAGVVCIVLLFLMMVVTLIEEKQFWRAESYRNHQMVLQYIRTCTPDAPKETPSPR